MTAKEHEEYPNAPVALVAVEIRFPGEIGSPVPSRLQRAVGDALGEDWVVDPVVVPQPGFSVKIGDQPVVTQPARFPPSAVLRFVDRDRGAAVAFTAGSASVEATRYRNWPTFRSTLDTVIRTAERLIRPSGMTRAGIRYIDEVHVEGVERAGWSEWLSPSVLPPATQAMTDAGWPPVAWTNATQYRIGEDRNLVFRYGPQGPQPGFVVNPDGPLHRPGPRPAGSFFLLDFDASWQPTSIPQWDTNSLLATYDELRHPVRTLFDQIVTERLVNEVFKKGTPR